MRSLPLSLALGLLLCWQAQAAGVPPSEPRRPRPLRTAPALVPAPPAPSASATWRPSIPPWSPDPLVLALPNRTMRLATLLPRIDRHLPPGEASAVPAYRPLARWVGETFVFLPADPGEVQEYEAFDVREDLSAYRFQPSYEDLVGRFAVVIAVRPQGQGGTADFRLDGEPVVLQGTLTPAGCLPGIAPVRELAVARRRYLGKRVVPRGAAVSKYHLPAGRPAVVTAIAPAAAARNPIRLLLEPHGRPAQTLDGGLSATNVPLADGRRSFDALDMMLEIVGP